VLAEVKSRRWDGAGELSEGDISEAEKLEGRRLTSSHSWKPSSWGLNLGNFNREQ